MEIINMISYLKVTYEDLLWELELPQDGGMKGAENSLVQVTEVIVSPKKGLPIYT